MRVRFVDTVRGVVAVAEAAEIGDARSQRRRANRANSVVALLGWVLLVAVAVLWGRRLLRDGVGLAISAPPLAGRYGWRVTSAAIAPAAVALAFIAVGPRVAMRCRWRSLVAVAAVASATWAIALSRIDGASGFLTPFHSDSYRKTVRTIHDPHVFLEQFVERIHSYESHTRGHPPGLPLLLWALERIGPPGIGWFVVLALVGGAAAAAAALVAVRDVADEGTARRAAPFLVLAPAAIWWSSGDAFFAGVAGWAVALLVVATGRDDRMGDVLALAGGLLWGITAFLSYGLALFALVPIVVAVARRRVRPLALAVAGAALVFAAFYGAGFSWFAGLAATRRQYWLGAARHRPFRYFVVADLAAAALALGPALAVALSRLRDRRVWLLVGSALAVIVLADLSAMSKAEVERIWLPFFPFVLVATSVFGHDREQRRWLALQAATAIAVELTVRSPW